MIIEITCLCVTGYIINSFLKEQKGVDESIKNILIRIHVNGIRGKTSVTRMIGSVLRNRYKTFTKTTGSEPKIIYPNGSEELIKREGLVNIKEQIEIIKKAHDCGVECIVFECMAVEPLLQRTLEERVMKSTIGVITNIRYDHEDVMGESLGEIAKSLCNTIPYNSILIVPKDISCLDVLIKVSTERNTKIRYADISNVPIGYSQRFEFMNFDENVAIVLEVADILGIPKNVALIDMLETKHDIGRGYLITKIVDDKKISFLNSFANNDVQSLIKMLSFVKFKLNDKKIGILSHRKDRIKRTVGMIPFIISYEFDTIVVNCDSNLIEDELRISGFKGEIITIDTNDREEVIKRIVNVSDHKHNYWIGLANIKTELADSVLDYFNGEI